MWSPASVRMLNGLPRTMSFPLTVNLRVRVQRQRSGWGAVKKWQPSVRVRVQRQRSRWGAVQKGQPSVHACVRVRE